MATIKKGNLFTHAKKSGQTIVLRKKSSAKKTAGIPALAVKKKRAKTVPVVRKKLVKKSRVKPVPAAKAFKYVLEVQKKKDGPWSVMLGSNLRETIKSLASTYASSYPKYAFRVME